MVYQGQTLGLLLPFVAATHNYDPLAFAQATINKAGLKEPPYYWCRFECVTWLADARGVHKLVGAFPRADEPTEGLPQLLAQRAALHTQYLLRQQKPDGTLYTGFDPFQNRLYEGVDLPRMGHAAWVLARAHRAVGGDELKTAADKALAYLLRVATDNEDGCWLEATDHTPTVSELSFLLLALCELTDEIDADRRARAARVAATLWQCVTLPHGRVVTHRPPAASPDEYQDYFPGQVLLALAAAAEAGVADGDEERLARSFRFYRHRFRYKRHFGQVSWCAQAFARWWRVTREDELARFVFEIVDWLLTFQQERGGGFINDHQPETPGYTTAVYLEAVGAALKLATARDDEARRKVYLDAYTRGLHFLDRLVIQPRDAALVPSPDYAVGGLRRAVYYSEVRTDFVQHALSAVLECYDLAAARDAARNFIVDTVSSSGY